jgi:pantothenate kinase
MTQSEELAAYVTFDRSEWAALRSSTPLTLSDSDLTTLRGLNEPIALDEVVDIYLPLSRLLNLHIAAARNLGRVRDAFLGRPARTPPYIIALAGSPAVGKSTFARVLRVLLARWPDHPRVQAGHTAPIMISDFFDFSVYLDAEEVDIGAWHTERFLILQRTAFQEPASYFHHYSGLSASQARDVAHGIWREINLVNLRENILPTRTHADVVLRKRSDHSVSEVWLRQT